SCGLVSGMDYLVWSGSSLARWTGGALFARCHGRRKGWAPPAVRPADFSSCEDNVGELIIVQHAVAGDLLRWQWHAFGWGLIEDGSTHAPAQECLGRLQGFVGSDRRPPLRDGSDDLNDIALANLVDAPTAPGLADLTAKEPRYPPPGPVLCQPLGNERLQQVLYAVCYDSSLRLPFLDSRIAAFELRREHLLRRHAGLVKGHSPIRSDRVLAQ